MAERIAAIDCGTNSIKILIGELPRVLVRESRMVRLGQGVDTTGLLGDWWASGPCVTPEPAQQQS